MWRPAPPSRMCSRSASFVAIRTFSRSSASSTARDVRYTAAASSVVRLRESECRRGNDTLSSAPYRDHSAPPRHPYRSAAQPVQLHQAARRAENPAPPAARRAASRTRRPKTPIRRLPHRSHRTGRTARPQQQRLLSPVRRRARQSP
uniref:Ser/Arg-related nuclear matrix-like protein n=1 Tax=Streptomyces flaveolus TaxID=67297 RepID=D3U9X9_9ACTN|nr:Ser/Arg-related nuclear matrix-like protein [Streptomyces flaveolus]